METQENSTAVAIPQAAEVFEGLLGKFQRNPATAWMVPTSAESAWHIAEILSKSEMVPKAYQGKPYDIMVAGMHGAAIGLPITSALQAIAVINGNPSLYGDGLIGLVRASKKLTYFKETFGLDGDGKTISCTCEVGRRPDPGDQPEPNTVITYSKDDAITAGLWMKKTHSGKATPWVTNPKRMLQMRARAFALRDKFADVLTGIASTEELRDLEITQEPSDDAPATAVDGAKDNVARMKEKLEASKAEQATDAEIVEEKSDRQLKNEVLKEMGELFEPIGINSADNGELIAAFVGCCLQKKIKKISAVSVDNLGHVTRCLRAIVETSQGDTVIAKQAIISIADSSMPILKPEVAADVVKLLLPKEAEEPELGV